MMLTLWARFRGEDCGAVTVDWVVLCAAVIGMGMLVLGPVAFEADSSARGISDYVRDVPIVYGSN
jgi:hypothetical protein